jgi:two-component system phosphate regulon sensor histidine kinase PhoR
MKSTVEDLIQRVLESESSAVADDCEALIVTNGKGCQISAVAAPIRKRDGSMLGVVIVFRDVSREREIERMKADFVSSISHELRTPLTSIKAYTATVLRDPDMDDKTRNDFLAIVDEESNRLAKLIEDLLEISRIESGTIELTQERVDIVPIIDHVSVALKALADKKEIQLETDINGEELPHIQGDASKIESVITNLVNNAIKFTPEQGKVKISAEHQGEELVIRVSDSGIGIPKTDLLKIFDRFYRVYRPGTEIQGTGLGLAIVKQIITMHNGRVEVDSEEGEGTTFTIFLPLNAQAILHGPVAC